MTLLCSRDACLCLFEATLDLNLANENSDLKKKKYAENWKSDHFLDKPGCSTEADQPV